MFGFILLEKRGSAGFITFPFSSLRSRLLNHFLEPVLFWRPSGLAGDGDHEFSCGTFRVEERTRAYILQASGTERKKRRGRHEEPLPFFGTEERMFEEMEQELQQQSTILYALIH